MDSKQQTRKKHVMFRGNFDGKSNLSQRIDVPFRVKTMKVVYAVSDSTAIGLYFIRCNLVDSEAPICFFRRASDHPLFPTRFPVNKDVRGTYEFQLLDAEGNLINGPDANVSILLELSD